MPFSKLAWLLCAMLILLSHVEVCLILQISQCMMNLYGRWVSDHASINEYVTAFLELGVFQCYVFIIVLFIISHYDFGMGRSMIANASSP